MLCIKSSWHRYGATFAQVMASCLRPQTITWTIVDVSLVVFCGIYLSAISQWLPTLPFCIISWNVWNCCHLPGANVLNCLLRYETTRGDVINFDIDVSIRTWTIINFTLYIPQIMLLVSAMYILHCCIYVYHDYFLCSYSATGVFVMFTTIYTIWQR